MLACSFLVFVLNIIGKAERQKARVAKGGSDGGGDGSAVVSFGWSRSGLGAAARRLSKGDFGSRPA